MPLLTTQSAKGFGFSGLVAALDSDFELIELKTLTSSAAFIEFTSIPSTYKHLHIRGIARSDRNGSADDLLMTMNGSTSYSNRRLNNDSSTIYAEGGNQTNIRLCRNNLPNDSINNSGFFLSFVIDILDYANTTTLKTAKIYSGLDTNSSSGNGNLYAGGMNLANTNAITSIKIFEETTANLVAKSSIGLYGIKG